MIILVTHASSRIFLRFEPRLLGGGGRGWGVELRGQNNALPSAPSHGIKYFAYVRGTISTLCSPLRTVNKKI